MTILIHKYIYKLGQELDRNKSSLLHGYLMEKTNDNFSDDMHITGFHPYTQYLYKTEEQYWCVSALNDYADKNLTTVLSNNGVITLTHNDIMIPYTLISSMHTDTDTLFKEHYFIKEQSRYAIIEFLTPCSFKSYGEYMIFPDIWHIFRSLIEKYNLISETKIDENDIDEICRCMKISSYSLRSSSFCLESVKIPSFLGKITIKCVGAKEMISLMHMLINFAEYSGIGIKTALGMGAVRKGDTYGNTSNRTGSGFSIT